MGVAHPVLGNEEVLILNFISHAKLKDIQFFCVGFGVADIHITTEPSDLKCQAFFDRLTDLGKFV